MASQTKSFHIHHWVTAAVTAAAMAACGGGSNTPVLKLNLTGLEDLGKTAVYEGWLLVNGAPVSSGRFSVDGAGKLSQTDFPITTAQADAATAFVLTIEPAAGDVPAPTDTHLLAGDFNANKTAATVSINHPAALGTNFSSALGKFFLATPTTGTETDDAQGIWFMEVVNGVARAGLTLPALPAKGWVYEGWVVVGGKPISTGRFKTAAGADSDGAGPAAGPLAAPPFPGQDFITPPLNLPGGMAVVSVEPEVDNSPAPFTLKPLAGAINNRLGPANGQTMTNTAADGKTLPGGSVTITR